MMNQCISDRSWTISHALFYYLIFSLITLTLAADITPEVTCGPLTNGIPGKESRSGRVSLSTTDHVICTGHWTDENAEVYCRQNKFTYGIALFYSVQSEASDANSPKKSIKSISCTGSESLLSECTPKDGSLCGDEYVGGVFCYNSKPFYPTIELGGELLNNHNASSMHGLVGLSLDGQIGSVSSEGWTDRNESRVLCRMFNYTRGRLLATTSDSIPGVGYIMTGVKCTGNEDSLFKCKVDRWQTKTGDHSKDIHVNCSYADNCGTPTPIEYALLHIDPARQEFPDGDVITYQCADGYIVSDNTDSTRGTFTCRDGKWEGKNITCRTIPDGVVSLVGGLPSAIDRTGRVLVVEDLVNKSICPEDWNANSAKVVCHEKGFTYGYPITMFHKGITYLSSTYTCNGDEETLRTCPKTDNPSSCNDTSKTVAGVICYKSPAYPPEVSIKPPNSSIIDGGLVVIMTSDQQMGICNKEWTDREAKVVCVEMGFRNGSIHGYQVMGVGTYVYKSFKCTGHEKKLLHCETGGWINASECGGLTHNAHVKCRNKEPLKDFTIQLTDGIPTQTNYTGRIFLAEKNVIKSICPKMLTEAVANVSCHQLGLEGGIPIRYENRTKPLFYGHVACIGTEASLDKCAYNASMQTCSDDDGTLEAGILCYKSQNFKPSFDLNLDPKTDFTDRGQVTLSLNGITGAICNGMWTQKDAGVFCRGLNRGFEDGEIRDFGMKGINYVLKSVSCTGQENTLFQCYFSSWLVMTDKKTQVCHTAQVKCLKPETTTPQPTTETPTTTPKPITTKPKTTAPNQTTTAPNPTAAPTVPTPENVTTTDNGTGVNETEITVLPTVQWSNETETNETRSGNDTANVFEDEEEADENGSSLAIPVSITCVVVVLLVIVGAFIYRRRRQHQQLMGYVRYNNEDITPSVVPQRDPDTIMIRDPARGELDMAL